jgi:hypothetical protein
MVALIFFGVFYVANNTADTIDSDAFYASLPDGPSGAVGETAEDLDGLLRKDFRVNSAARVLSRVFAGLAIAMLAGALVVMLIFYRCPHCKAYLGRDKRGQYCRWCGKTLE